jgi:hypothetical protein
MEAFELNTFTNHYSNNDLRLISIDYGEVNRYISYYPEALQLIIDLYIKNHITKEIACKALFELGDNFRRPNPTY